MAAPAAPEFTVPLLATDFGSSPNSALGVLASALSQPPLVPTCLQMTSSLPPPDDFVPATWPSPGSCLSPDSSNVPSLHPTFVRQRAASWWDSKSHACSHKTCMGLPFGKAPELPLGCRPWLQHAPHAGESVDRPSPVFAPHDHPGAPARLRAGSISPLASALGLSPSTYLGLFPSGARSPKRRIRSGTETNAFGSPRFPCLRPGSNLPSPFRPDFAPTSGRPRLLTPRLQRAPNPQLRPAPSPDFRWPAPSHLSRFWTSSRSPPTPSITTTHGGFTPSPSLAPPSSSSRPPRRVSVFSHRATRPQHSDHSAADHDSCRGSSSPSAASSSCCQAPPPFLSPFPSLCRNSGPEPSSRVQFSVPASSRPTCMGPEAACMGPDHARPDHAHPRPPAPELPLASYGLQLPSSPRPAPLGLLPSASTSYSASDPLPSASDPLPSAASSRS